MMIDKVNAYYDKAFYTSLVQKHFGDFGNFGY